MTEYVNSNLGAAKTIRDIVHMLVAATTDAQLAIIDGPEETWVGGRTTANIGK